MKPNDDDVEFSKGCNVVIIGAGPAGLTAAYEILTRTDLHPIVLEATDCVGGISRTTVHHNNRIDIGGHRFFSKSDRVMSWWQQMMPIQGIQAESVSLNYQGATREMEGSTNGPDPESTDLVMLVRSRKSRIYYLGKLFDYPLSLSVATLRGLGLPRVFRIGTSYARSCLLPIRREVNLEDFFINRFGRELYRTFFKSYTEKVWGVSCREISAEWGAQRIKGLNGSWGHGTFSEVLPFAKCVLWQDEAETPSRRPTVSFRGTHARAKVDLIRPLATASKEEKATGIHSALRLVFLDSA